MKGQTDAVRWLLNSGARRWKLHPRQRTEACRARQRAVACRAPPAGGSGEVTPPPDDSAPPAHLSAWLLLAGIKVNSKMRNGSNALMIAAKHGELRPPCPYGTAVVRDRGALLLSVALGSCCSRIPPPQLAIAHGVVSAGPGSADLLMETVGTKLSDTLLVGA